MARWMWLACAATCALSACATAPAVPAPKALAQASNESLAAPVADWPAETWWAGYQDAQLTALIEEGLKGSPGIALAEARLRRAAALVGEAAADQMPGVNASAALAQAKTSYNSGQFIPQRLRGWNEVARAQLDISYEVDFWRKFHHATAAAKSDRAAARAELAAARLVISTSIAQAYGDLAARHAQHAVLERAKAVREETLAATRRRVAAGYDSQIELKQAEAATSQATADLAAVGEELALNRVRLAVLMGASPDRGLRIEAPPSATLKPYGLPAELPAQLLGRRPDVAAARLRAEAASHRIAQAKARFYPNVNLLALVGANALGASALFDRGSDYSTLGGAISLPIFDGGRRVAGYGMARADFDAAVATYDEALVKALGDVASVIASQRALAARLENSQAALAASMRGWELAKRGYEAGATDYPTVLLAEDRMLEGKQAVALLEARRFALDLALVRALGGGWREDT
jgi:NodT family efflux transporter outer membrane factor (OMF) lipoprotein